MHSFLRTKAWTQWEIAFNFWAVDQTVTLYLLHWQRNQALIPTWADYSGLGRWHGRNWCWLPWGVGTRMQAMFIECLTSHFVCILAFNTHPPYELRTVVPFQHMRRLAVIHKDALGHIGSEWQAPKQHPSMSDQKPLLFASSVPSQASYWNEAERK